MTKRSPFAVFIFAILTFGIYSWYWYVKTKTELNQRGAAIPTCWVWLIPYVGLIYWLVKYAQGVETVSAKQTSTVAAFLWLFLTGPIGQAVLQSKYNSLDQAVAVPGMAIPA